MGIVVTSFLFNWNRFTEYAHDQGFEIPNYGTQTNYAVSQNEMDVVAELVDRLVHDAKQRGDGKVSAFPIGWGSMSGGIKFKFTDPRQAALWKLSWK